MDRCAAADATVHAALVAAAVAEARRTGPGQGLTLVHVSAQRKRFLCDTGRI